MEDVRRRIGAIKWLLSTAPLGQHDFLSTELICVQFRKILELIAFGSLTANQEAYAAVHQNFGSHWKARNILKEVENLNPHFYPVPLEEPRIHVEGRKHFLRKTEGILTPADFEVLYGLTSGLLHTRNPFSQGPATFRWDRPIDEWVLMIQRLLALHAVRFVGDDQIWLVVIPPDGPVAVYPAGAARGDI